MTFRTFVRPLMVSLSLAFATVAAPALADGGNAPADQGTKGKSEAHANHGKSDDNKGRGHDKADGASKGKSDDATAKGKGKGGLKRPDFFPLPADKFSKHVEDGLSRAKDHVTKALEKGSVPEATRKLVLKQFEDGAVAVRAAAKRVGADGTVTKAEAREVRQIVKDAKEKVRDLLPEKEKSAKSDKADRGHKGKGKGKANDKASDKPAPKDV